MQVVLKYPKFYAVLLTKRYFNKHSNFCLMLGRFYAQQVVRCSVRAAQSSSFFSSYPPMSWFRVLPWNFIFLLLGLWPQCNGCYCGAWSREPCGLVGCQQPSGCSALGCACNCTPLAPGYPTSTCNAGIDRYYSLVANWYQPTPLKKSCICQWVPLLSRPLLALQLLSE